MTNSEWHDGFKEREEKAPESSEEATEKAAEWVKAREILIGTEDEEDQQD